jgi:hypothetical protein
MCRYSLKLLKVPKHKQKRIDYNHKEKNKSIERFLFLREQNICFSVVKAVKGTMCRSSLSAQ